MTIDMESLKSEICTSKKTTLLLLNRKDKIVGGLYSNHIDVNRLLLTTLDADKSDERYLLYYNGMGIYFSSYKRIDQ